MFRFCQSWVRISICTGWSPHPCYGRQHVGHLWLRFSQLLGKQPENLRMNALSESHGKQCGWTMLEILIVVSILGILAAVGFVISGPLRESGRQATCSNNLRQVYAALAQYASDNDATSAYPELHGLAYCPGPTHLVLKPYGYQDSMRYCPNSPIALKDRMYSTYLSPILATPKDDVNAVNSPRKYMIEKEKRLGTALPIVECHIHDEFYYARVKRENPHSCIGQEQKTTRGIKRFGLAWRDMAVENPRSDLPSRLIDFRTEFGPHLQGKCCSASFNPTQPMRLWDRNGLPLDCAKLGCTLFELPIEVTWS